MNNIGCIQSQRCSQVAALVGAVTVIAGVFLILAAQQVLPNGVNTISQLGAGGVGIGAGVFATGTLIMTCGLIKMILKDLETKSGSSTRAQASAPQPQASASAPQPQASASAPQPQASASAPQPQARMQEQPTAPEVQASAAAPQQHRLLSQPIPENNVAGSVFVCHGGITHEFGGYVYALCQAERNGMDVSARLDELKQSGMLVTGSITRATMQEANVNWQEAQDGMMCTREGVSIGMHHRQLRESSLFYIQARGFEGLISLPEAIFEPLPLRVDMRCLSKTGVEGEVPGRFIQVAQRWAYFEFDGKIFSLTMNPSEVHMPQAYADVELLDPIAVDQPLPADYTIDDRLPPAIKDEMGRGFVNIREAEVRRIFEEGRVSLPTDTILRLSNHCDIPGVSTSSWKLDRYYFDDYFALVFSPTGEGRPQGVPADAKRVLDDGTTEDIKPTIYVALHPYTETSPKERYEKMQVSCSDGQYILRDPEEQS